MPPFKKKDYAFKDMKSSVIVTLLPHFNFFDIVIDDDDDDIITMG